MVDGRRGIAAIALIVLIAIAGACGGGSSRFKRYQDQASALKAIDAMLAEIPQFPGARLLQGTVESTGYRVSTNHVIQAEPYERHLDYAVPAGRSGADVQRWFRKQLTTKGWICSFHRRVPGVPYGFSCAKRARAVAAFIDDDGQYQLDAEADSRPAPIKTVTSLGD
jgi:hypothetical protein